MSGFLYLTRTIPAPATADGCSIKAADGTIVAVAYDVFMAAAVADLINLAQPAARHREEEHDRAEERKARALFLHRRA